MASIAIDVDDTLYSFTDEAREVLSVMIDEPEYALYKEQLTHALYAKWDQWRTPFELCGHNDHGDSLWLECIARCHDTEAILRQRPFQGAVQVLKELAWQGHSFVYISNRATETYEATLQWLTEQGFPVDPTRHELVVTAGDKRPYVRACQYMIDDRPKNVIQFVYDRECGYRDDGSPWRQAFVKVTDYNSSLTDVPGLKLAHTWAGLRRYMVKEGLLPAKELAHA